MDCNHRFLISFTDIQAAAGRIRAHLYQTPFELDPVLSEELGCKVYLKLELQQLSGSFKARGAFNKILSVPAEQRKETTFIAASTGNHAAAFCTALQMLSLRGQVFLPKHVSPSKLAFIRSMKVPFELYGDNSLQTELYARKVSGKPGCTLVHPYNDPLIIAGQGTVGLEMMDQQHDLDLVVLPVGGGGLISGVGLACKTQKPEVQIVGCQPAQSPEMIFSIRQGSIITEEISKPTLSDGTAGGMEPNSMTFAMCQHYVDDWHLIEEDAIAFEILSMLRNRQMLIEGAAALPLAYCRAYQHELKGKKVGLVITGKRIAFTKLQSILND